MLTYFNNLCNIENEDVTWNLLKLLQAFPLNNIVEKLFMKENELTKIKFFHTGCNIPYSV
jgi:hypothetical protein